MSSFMFFGSDLQEKTSLCSFVHPIQGKRPDFIYQTELREQNNIPPFFAPFTTNLIFVSSDKKRLLRGQSQTNGGGDGRKVRSLDQRVPGSKPPSDLSHSVRRELATYL